MLLTMKLALYNDQHLSLALRMRDNGRSDRIVRGTGSLNGNGNSTQLTRLFMSSAAAVSSRRDPLRRRVEVSSRNRMLDSTQDLY